MNRRLTRWLLALYPRYWRDRYGTEVASLNEELINAGETTPLRAGLNLLAGAAVERGRALAASRHAVLAAAAAAIIMVAVLAFGLSSGRATSAAARADGFTCTVPGGVRLPGFVGFVQFRGKPATRRVVVKGKRGPGRVVVQGKPGQNFQAVAPPGTKPPRPAWIAFKPGNSVKGIARCTVQIFNEKIAHPAAGAPVGANYVIIQPGGGGFAQVVVPVPLPANARQAQTRLVKP
jgi:hypothetical protein